MTKNKINFTLYNLKNLPHPQANKRYYYYDNKVPGLGIMVFPSGTKTFFLYKRVDGKPDKIKLGRFPDMSPEQASISAYKIIGQIIEGQNPNQNKNNIRSEYSLEKLFDKYLNEYARLHKLSWKIDKDLFEYHLSGFKKRKISSIKNNDLMSLHIKIGKNAGRYAANRVLALLSTIFNKAIEWGWNGANPCKGVKRFKEESRDRFLQSHELPRFFKALQQEGNNLFKDYFYILLLTGARKRNVLSMKWVDIDFDKKIWKISKTKNGEALSVHLSEYAIKILKARVVSKESCWVFPSDTSTSGHIEEPKKAWKRVLKTANIADLRIHDLRRTLGSWQAATGANSYIIGKSLGHKTQAATAIYARLNLDPVRESVNKATEAMFTAANLGEN